MIEESSKLFWNCIDSQRKQLPCGFGLGARIGKERQFNFSSARLPGSSESEMGVSVSEGVVPR